MKYCYPHFIDEEIALPREEGERLSREWANHQEPRSFIKQGSKTRWQGMHSHLSCYYPCSAGFSILCAACRLVIPCSHSVTVSFFLWVHKEQPVSLSWITYFLDSLKVTFHILDSSHSCPFSLVFRMQQTSKHMYWRHFTMVFWWFQIRMSTFGSHLQRQHSLD